MLVGAGDGIGVGAGVGVDVGAALGIGLGYDDGDGVGSEVGKGVGATDGSGDGAPAILEVAINSPLRGRVGREWRLLRVDDTDVSQMGAVETTKLLEEDRAANAQLFEQVQAKQREEEEFEVECEKTKVSNDEVIAKTETEANEANVEFEVLKGEEVAVDAESPEAEAERARRKLEIAQQIMTDPFLLDFQQETGLLGIFETAQEKQAREEFEDKFLVTPIFLEGRKPMTAAKSVEELSTGEIAVNR